MRISDWSADVSTSDLIDAAWKKISKAERPYVSVTLDDPSFPATVYARLIENEGGTHDLIWSRSKPQAATFSRTFMAPRSRPSRVSSMRRSPAALKARITSCEIGRAHV